MAHILVTGVNGFVGHHMVGELKKHNHKVTGTGTRAQADPRLKLVLDNYIGGCDLTKHESVKKLPLKEIDAVINLAGLAQVGASFDQPDVYMHVNVAVHETLVAELKRLGRNDVRVVAVSSGAVYENNQPMPLKETSALIKDGSPYAKSKVAMEAMLHKYQNEGMNIVVARPFNHIGPGQGGGFLIPDLFQKLLGGKPVTVGSLATERDYTDVRDVVCAYALLATQPNLKDNLYNVCSGKSISGDKILRTVLRIANKSDTPVTVDPSLIRPSDPQRIVGDSTRLRQAVGWTPKIELEQTISDVFAELS